MGQLTDGIFQSALASFVLFSPERQPDAKSAAVAFAVVLLPYSLVGPFVGTILDRVSRQRVILFANLFRALVLIFIAGLVRNGATGIELTIFVLLAFGVNRLILAGLSAGLPLLIDTTGTQGRNNLVSINATTVTGGTVFVVLGGGIGIGLRGLLEGQVNANQADGILISLAAACFFIAGLLALRLKKEQLGPLEHEVKKQSVFAAYQEMVDGAKFLYKIRDCFLGITATAVQRGGLTALTLMALLLNRNTFNDPANPESGLAGFAFAITVAGIGITIGAVIAPFGVKRFGRHAWIRYSLYASAVVPIALAFEQNELLLVATGFFTGMAGQGVKVTNDALVQSKIVDEFRGRVFAVYDVMVNAGIVSGAIIAAFVLPPNGVSAVLPALIAVVYVIVALVLLRPKQFNSDF
ncbi:MAG: MFS transporter [Candidatus Nanopelagicaceae bacterium]|nr:MFS transporter [Candidatus Nanopelagicaceae bacterium]